MFMKLVLSACENSDMNIWSDRQAFGLEYSDDVLLRGDPSKLQVLDCLNDTSYLFAMGFASTQCKILSQNWIGSKPNFLSR